MKTKIIGIGTVSNPLVNELMHLINELPLQLLLTIYVVLFPIGAPLDCLLFYREIDLHGQVPVIFYNHE